MRALVAAALLVSACGPSLVAERVPVDAGDAGPILDAGHACSGLHDPALAQCLYPECANLTGDYLKCCVLGKTYDGNGCR